MPFPMIHLLAAKKLIDDYVIEYPEAFLCGAISPDAVHVRDDYNPDMKLVSHLCPGGVKWGHIEDSDGWRDIVLSHMDQGLEGRIRSFELGYICHVLLDIQNNIKVWRPFLKENLDRFMKEGISDYHMESNQVDLVLGQSRNGEEVLSLLRKVSIIGYRDIIMASEIKKMLDDLYKRYEENEPSSVEHNQYVRIDEVRDFIEEEAGFIGELLFA